MPRCATCSSTPLLGGVWIAVMQFNLLPSVLLVTMLAIDKVSLGGPRLLARTLTVLVAACGLTSAALGFPIDVDSPMSVIVAYQFVPFIVIYPIAINVVTHLLASKVAQQNRLLDELEVEPTG